MTSEFFENGLAAYQKLFWPDFVEHDDCVFLALDEAIYRQWLQQTGGDKRKVEAVMNHRHIIDLLSIDFFREFRKAGASPGTPSDDPIAVLEDFAKCVGIMLEAASNPNSQKWVDAIQGNAKIPT
jgi:hypothetical protein